MRSVYLSGLLLALLSPFAHAEMESEIQHLLNFVAHSHCSFERNGSRYTSPEAKEHINMKYEHFRDRVKTTEDFIKYAASRSSMSGSPSTVTCDGKQQTSAGWLSQELDRYRAEKGN